MADNIGSVIANSDLLLGVVDASWLIVRSRQVDVSDYKDIYPSGLNGNIHEFRTQPITILYHYMLIMRAGEMQVCVVGPGYPQSRQ